MPKNFSNKLKIHICVMGTCTSRDEKPHILEEEHLDHLS